MKHILRSVSHKEDVYVLGYSGLDGYIDYKNRHLDGLTLHESLVGQGMDAAAALLKNGSIVAASAEERFTGNKHTGSFPKSAIESCLKIAGIPIERVNTFVHNFNFEPYAELYRQSVYTEKLYEEVLSDASQIALFQKYFNLDVSGHFIGCDHHSTHAAYAFETSGFPTSLVMVTDGLGEFSSISIYSADTTSGLTMLASHGPESSLGMLYSAVTDYLGFITNSDEYKIMGLAAYGDPERYSKLFDEILMLGDKGSVQINHLLPQHINTPMDRETYRPFKQWLSTQIFPERQPEEEVNQDHKDLTAALQHKVNEAMLHVAKYWQSVTEQKNLCIAGGVALNCVANSYIAAEGIFEKLYIPPAAADDGTALGAALVCMRRNGQLLDTKYHVDMPFYGPKITLTPNNPIINQHNLKVVYLEDDELSSLVAQEVSKGKIVALAQGRMEYGPRALGHRSILADPRSYKMRERLNIVTKQRESFRPFAPMVKEEAAKKYFEIAEGAVYKHMLINVSVRNDARNELQAITHIDGTARVQTVSKREMPLIWNILDRLEHLISVPIVLNTSFNLKSMPIVCTEDDALNAYVTSDIDLLVINNYVIYK